MRGRLLTRLLLFLMVVFGVMATATALLSSREIAQALENEYKARALALARSIADGNTELLLERSAGNIQAAIDQHQEMGDLSYIAVVDSQGDVVAHTFTPGVPDTVRGLMAAMRPGENGSLKPEIRTLTLEDGSEVIHVAQPVLGGRAGFVHIGMSTAPIREAMASAILRQHLLTLAVFMLCLAVAFLFIRNIAAKLASLAAYAQRVAAHDFSSDCEVRSNDEIGALAESMRGMAGQIAGHVTQLEQSVAEATRELKDALGSLSAIVGNIGDGLLVARKGRILKHNAALLRIFGLENADYMAGSARRVFGAGVGRVAAQAEEDDAPGEADAVLDATPARLTEVLARRGDGQSFPVEITVARVPLTGGAASVCILRDVTEARRRSASARSRGRFWNAWWRTHPRAFAHQHPAQDRGGRTQGGGDALRRAESKFRGIFENAVEGIFQISPEGRYLSANPAMAAIMGFASPEELVAYLSEHSPYLEPGRRQAFLDAMERDGEVKAFESQVRRKSGRIIWVSENARKVVDLAGKTLHYDGFVEDITLRKEAEGRLLHQAFHDPLTGLPNRLLFLDHLRMAMDRARRRADFRFAVLYMDLDRFKIINDSLGHDIGDKLLRHVSGALVACARSTDTVARFGGDEFAILLEDLTARATPSAFRAACWTSLPGRWSWTDAR
jgi:PAS domain S-box-containing protein